jgi:hypothetical protein
MRRQRLCGVRHVGYLNAALDQLCEQLFRIRAEVSGETRRCSVASRGRWR